MKVQAGPGFLKRRIEGLRRLWGDIAGDAYDEEAAALRPNLPPEDRPRLLKKMRACLDEEGGEIRARARSAALGKAYLALNPQGRGAFLRLLAREFDMDPEEISRALEAWSEAETPFQRRGARKRLLRVAGSPRTRILTRFNALPQGVKFLADLRSDLLPLAKEEPDLASLDDDLKALLVAWFDPGFLELRRISWDSATGALLEKFMAYEAVHPVENWTDLKDRLDYDRRYFAFFHPRMPGEPLIFLEVALVESLASSIQTLLDPAAPTTDPKEADTAIFYSISNAQKGLAGVSFGGFLIKRVVEELAREFPDLRTFSTLSPLPGFRRWLETRLSARMKGEGRGPEVAEALGKGPNRVAGSGETLLLPGEEKKLRRLDAAVAPEEFLAGLLGDASLLREPEVEKAVRPILLRLAARYLAKERREGGGALDPVAHFHLSNGARLERMNWLGDVSEKGMEQSAGIMVNYLYDGRKIDANHEAYRTQGRVVTSSGVRGLLKG